MSWREERRSKLESLCADDAACIVIQFDAISRQDGRLHPPRFNVSTAAMIETILDHEERQRQSGGPQDRTI